MISEESLLRRIEDLLTKKGRAGDYDVAGEVYVATLSVATQLYGAGSPQAEAVKQLKSDVRATKWGESEKPRILVNNCHGILRAFVSDIQDGRLGSLRLEYQGQIFADIINAAKNALDEEARDVAAVLACASLEDALKRYGEAKGLDVEDKELSAVINALKSKGLLSTQQGTILKGMVSLRNRAFHAQWDKIDNESVRSVIAFVEQFLTTHYA